ncbi:competence protein CoiA family protein [Streptomyces sp. NPDC001933]|uniref:competence protein CoiA family protein n=1 Tax=Streptomyces sp. NPDC001933 TaxID=3364626 RepID=UPI0036BFACFE
MPDRQETRFMPFTALHPELGRLDSTLPGLGHGLEWGRIHKARPRVPLTCPDCSWGLHPKVSRYGGYGVRFFCHDPGRPPSCELSNESWEHHMLKLEMAGAIRAAGWFAALEVPAEDGSWRADVMASSADGSRRMAWEAQLSQITVDDIADRTDRYADEGIRVCWVHPGARPPQWISAVPAVRVRAPKERGQPWVVDDGLAGFVYRSGRWEFREETLERFVRWALEGQLVPAEVLRRYRRVYRVVDGERRRFKRDQWWTSKRSVADQGRHEVMRQRQEAERAEREEAAERRRKELEEQERVRKAEEDERRRLQREEGHRVFMEQTRRRWAQEEARREQERVEREARLARELAEREERERRDLETARVWWGRLSAQQQSELFAAVAEYAWRTSNLRVEVPEKPMMRSQYAHGVPVHVTDKRRSLYGIVRPCPGLAGACPKLAEELVLARSAQEARELADVLPRSRIVDLVLPEHEQLTMC